MFPVPKIFLIYGYLSINKQSKNLRFSIYYIMLLMKVDTVIQELNFYKF